jgi:hypothetical protein
MSPAKAQSNPNEKMDIDRLVDDVVFAVSLILNGITIQ